MIDLGRIDALQFVSARNGWAIITSALDGQQDVVDTEDGGHHWVVSQPIPAGDSARLTVVPSGMVYVLLQTPTGVVSVLRSANGGQTWLSAPLPAPASDSSLMASFAVRGPGWLLACAPPSLSGTQCTLFRTNAGRQWHQVSTFPVLDMIPNGITFVGAHGWITGQTHGDYPATVRSTRDGGHTWVPIALAIPDDSATNADTYPVIRQAGAVLLPTILYEKQGAGFLLYTVVDGTFRPTMPLSTAGAPTEGDRSSRYSIAPRSMTYVLSSPDLYRTTNGGQTWIVANGHVPTWSALDFVTPTVGYSSNPGSPNMPPTLWTTTDGGQTWTRVRYSVTVPARGVIGGHRRWLGVVN